MRRNPVCFIWALFFFNTLTAQGKFAGSMKKLIGKAFADSKKIEGLSGWSFSEGTVITPIDDPEMITVDLFSRGTTRLVILGYKEDTAFKKFDIADVLEIKNVPAGWQVKTSVCRQNKEENVEIVALVKNAKTMYFTVVKQAWRLNRDKKRIEGISILGIDCLNEGFN